jgi:hypothetical protein
MDEANREQCICKALYTGSYCELTRNNCSNSSGMHLRKL